jgi:Protein of unknown function (DUF3352)
LLAAGCGGTTEQIGSTASSIVPASAPAFIAFDTDPSSQQWQTMMSLADKFPDKEKGVREIKKELRKDPGVEWEADVKPALGDEVDVVWLDFENDGENIVGLLQPKNEGKFKELVEKVNKSEQDPDEKAVYEKFRGWYVISDKQELIDRFKQESDSATKSLADDKAFKQSMDRLGEDSVLRAYVNGKFLMDLIRRYGGPQVQPYINKVGTLDWIATRFGATSEGIGLDAIVHGTPGSLFKGAPGGGTFKPKLLGTVPKDALLYLTFHGTKGMFDGLQKNAFFNAPEYREFAKPLKDLGRILEGENAIYLRPGTARSPDVPFAIPEVTLISTPRANGVGILDRWVKRYAGTPPQADSVGGTPVHAMASNGLGLYYANVDGKFVVTDQPSGIRSVKDGGESLSDSENFQAAKDASGLPDKTYGFLYVDISSSIPYGEKLAQQRLPADIARNVKPLRSAVEYAAAHTHELQVTFFLRIK